MSESASTLLQWLNANPHWSGLITFLISTSESVAIIGTIVPGSVMMTAIGTLAGAGIIPLWPTILWAILGAIVGDGISYWIGHYYKDSLHNIWPFRTHPEMLSNGELFFKKHGGMSIFIGRFVGPVRALVPVVAGIFGVRPIVFTIANILSAIGWAPVYMLPGILLGAASLELPPDVTTHAVVMLLLFGLLFILCIWLIKKLFSSIHDQVNQFLNWTWQSLGHSKYLRIVTSLLRHYNPAKTHGQIVLAFYFIVVVTAFVLLAAYVSLVPPNTLPVNNVLFHLFRSFRSPGLDTVLLHVTTFGEAQVILPFAGLVCAWLAYTKRWRTAAHLLALIVLGGISVELIKILVHSHRPWGLVNSPQSGSFPSGHSTLSLAFYIGLGALLSKIWKLKKWGNRLLFFVLGTVVLIIGLTRIYFGLHWFTDVVGGWLLGTALLILIAISYNRSRETKAIQARPLLIVCLLSLSIFYGIYCYRNINTMYHDYQTSVWPTYNISLDNWWNQKGDHLPLFRINRFGLEQEILNFQWLGSLEKIKTVLLNNGWSVPPEHDWISILKRVTDVESAEHLPLVSPLHLDKKPILVLTKQYNSDKKLLVLRLWESNTTVGNLSLPLWVGSVDIVPRTYSWLFKNTRSHRIALVPAVIFNKIPSNVVIKQALVRTHQDKERPLILIKPK